MYQLHLEQSNNSWRRMCGQFIPKNSPNQTRAINNSICDRETVLLCQMATFRVKTTTAHMAEMTLNKKTRKLTSNYILCKCLIGTDFKFQNKSDILKVHRPICL